MSQTSHATVEESVGAVHAAVAALGAWRLVSLDDRRRIIKELLSKILASRDEFARTITCETGKTWSESQQEIEATIDESNVQLAVFQNQLTEDVGDHQVRFEPLGACLLITPSNFPLAAVMRKLVPALLAGNTVVVKASELTPMTAQLLYQAIDSLGLAAGVANLVLAEGRSVVGPMVDVPGLRAISLTGSSETGEAIVAAIAGRDIRLQAEMGGSNAVVILADADLLAAASAVSSHGFSCSGQWCTGTTRVFVEKPVYDRFMSSLMAAVEKIVVGPGLDSRSDMGALTSESQLKKVENEISKLCRLGARILRGGKRPTAASLRHGWFLEPTIIEGDDCDEDCLDSEIFGPVIVVVKVVDPQDALRRANASRYGLSFSVFTNDTEIAEEMIGRAEAGLCHVNLGTGVRDNRLPLAGWKQSGRGIPECGVYARNFFTQTKAVYRATSGA